MNTSGGDTPGSPAVPRCSSLGHELLPAAALGVFEDDEGTAWPDVPYCPTCARALQKRGEYRVTTVLDPLAWGTAPCDSCGGTGRIPGKNTPAARDALTTAQRRVSEIEQLTRDFDDVALTDMDAFFYQHAFSELRLAVDDLLKLLVPRSSAGEGRQGDL